jgi:single-stranded-DNA-specific exonuclease
LALADARHPGLITRFGGHAMAAGLTLDRDMFPVFHRAFMSIVSETLDPDLLHEIILTDGSLTEKELCRETAVMLADSGPWGQGFPVPVFDNAFEVVGWQVLKDKHLKLQLKPVDGKASIQAIHFSGYSGKAPPPRVRVVYELQTNDFRERHDVQLLIRHIEEV